MTIDVSKINVVLFNAPLKNINDNYEKTILTLDRVYNETSEEGIKCRNIIDFLLEE